MNILAVYDGSGPKYHRVLLGCHGLEQYGHKIKVVYNLQPSDFEGIDIVFYNRIIPSFPIEKLVEMRNQYGFKIVCDLDDHWQLGKDHILHKGYERNSLSQKIEDNIRQADIVTVTHERLRQEVLSLNSNCHVFPNSIPKVQQFLTRKVPSDLTRLFWAGGVTHRNDLALLKRPLQLIKRDKVQLVICGYVEGHPEWKEMAKMYTTDSSYNTKVFESLPVHEYYRCYAHCDISLIPLVENRFNSFKSNLKILEAANIGAPVIVSRVDPYLDFPEDMVNYVDMHKPWVYQIKRLVNDKDLQIEQGIKLQQYVNEHYNFERISYQRNKLFNAAIEHRKATEVQAEAGSVAQ